MWRKFQEQDARRGVGVSFGFKDEVFNGGVIIAVKPVSASQGVTLTIARPMARAHALYDDNQPMLYTEIVEMSLGRACETLDVCVDRTGKARTYTVG